MKSYLQLTFRYIKNKKRASISLFISIFLITSLLLYTMGFLTINLAHENIITREVKGDYIYGFVDIDKEKAMSVKYNAYVNESVLGKIEGYVDLNRKNDRGNNLYAEIEHFEKNSFNETFSIELESGRYPENKNEVMIEKQMLSILNTNLNDEVTLSMLEYPVKGANENMKETSHLKEEKIHLEDRTYKIVGIYKEGNFTYNRPLVVSKIIGYLDEYNEGNYEAYVKKLESGVEPNVILNDNSKKIDEDKFYKGYKGIQENTVSSIFLTMIESKSGKADNNIVFIIFIVLFTIILIRNSINISIIEKKDDIILLNQVGASISQIKKIVIGEMTIVSIIAELIAIVFSYILNEVIYVIIDNPIVRSESIFINIKMYLILAVSMFILIIISSYSYFRGESIELFYTEESSRLRDEYKSINPKRIEKSLAIRLLGKYKKNFSRASISISMSICLLILFLNQMLMFELKYKGIDKSDKWDVIYTRSQGHITTQEVKEISSINDVEDVYICNSATILIPIKEENLGRSFSNLGDRREKGIFSYNGYAFLESKIKCLTDKQLEQYNLEGKGVSMSELDNYKTILCNNMVYYDSYDNYRITHTPIPLDKGDKILVPNNEKLLNNTDSMSIKDLLVSSIDNRDFTEVTIESIVKNDDFKASKLDEENPYLLFNEDYINKDQTISLYVSEEVFKKLVGNKYKDELLIKIKEGGSTESIFEKAIAKGDRIKDYNSKNKRFKDSYKVISSMNLIFTIVLVLVSLLAILNTVIGAVVLIRKVILTLSAIGMDKGSLNKIIYYETFILLRNSLLVGGGIGIGFTLYSQVIMLKKGINILNQWIFVILISILAIYVLVYIGLKIFTKYGIKIESIQNIKYE